MSRDTDEPSTPRNDGSAGSTAATDGFQFTPSAALLFMFLGGLATLVALGGLGYLSTATVSELTTRLGTVVVVAAAVGWVLQRLRGR